MWMQTADLGGAAQAARPDAGSLRQGGKARFFVGNHGIQRICALGNGSDNQAFQKFGGEVFHAVYGKIYLVVNQRPFQFPGKQALLTDLREPRQGGLGIDITLG